MENVSDETQGNQTREDNEIGEGDETREDNKNESGGVESEQKQEVEK